MKRRWHDYAIDTDTYVQLEDLASVLSDIDFQLDFTYGSYVDLGNLRLTISSFWEMVDERTQLSGYYTDVYLRSIGTVHFTNLNALEKIRQTKAYRTFPQFLKQLITVFEDIRLEEQIKRRRPGTVSVFRDRTDYLRKYFWQMLVNERVRKSSLDELYCLIYLTLQADRPDQRYPNVQRKQLDLLERIKSSIYDVFSATSTAEVVQLALLVVQRILDIFNEDMVETYFSWPIFSWEQEKFTEQTLFDQLKRTDDVISGQEELLEDHNNEYIDETFSTWHTETELREGEQTFLRMALDEGMKTDIIGGTARETESSDQAFASVQGRSQKSEQKQYDTKKSLDEIDDLATDAEDNLTYGADHLYAKPIWFTARHPTLSEEQTYEAYVTEIKRHQLKLSRTIEKVIEHEQSMQRDQLHYGRLSKNLIPMFTDKLPRLFYKKDGKSNTFDAVFTLMVDCSASMYDKMDHTKRGVVLFHEVLKDLKIPHEIIGFWETTSGLHRKEWPNYFQVIHSFSDSLHKNNGAKIMQLQPEEDNRDGYSIRLVTERLLNRKEKHKILLVFSDGEPSAEQYEQNGIIDTQRAVSDVRKRGVNVIGMFLSQGEISETTNKMMAQIYGNDRLMISDVTELPDYFLPVLRRLILRII